MSVCWALGLFCRSQGPFVLLLVMNPQLLPVRPGESPEPPGTRAYRLPSRSLPPESY